MINEKILELAHRHARHYKHNDNPSLITYGFDSHTLINFFEALIKANLVDLPQLELPMRCDDKNFFNANNLFT